MRARGWELVAPNESTVVAEPFLDAAVVEDSESNRRFSNSTCTDGGDGFEVFSETNDLVN